MRVALWAICLLACDGGADGADIGLDGSVVAPDVAVGCSDASLTLADGACTAAWACPAGWRRTDAALGCVAPPPESGCGPGRFGLPDGRCTSEWACPDGWARIEDRPPTDGEGVPVRPRVDIGCAPVEDGCPAAQLATPGGGCDDLDLADCSGGPWGDRDWPAGTRFVQGGTDAPGDGSQARPHPTVVAALEAAEVGGTIAIAPGEYPERLYLERDVQLYGRCAADVSVGPVWVKPGATTVLEDVTVQGRPEVPTTLYASGGRLEGRRLRIRGEPRRWWRWSGARSTWRRCASGRAPRWGST